MHDDPQRWRFEAPLERRALRLQALFAVGLGVFLLNLAASALQRTAAAPFVVAIAGACFFLLCALSAWRRSSAPHGPLLLDARGVHVDDGHQDPWSVPWQRLERVELRRHPLRGARVVLLVREEGAAVRELTPRVYGDAPPQWIAGVIETFRCRFSAPTG